MKIYILQQDYTEIDPEAYWDEESGGYDSGEYACRDIIGVFVTLDSVVSKMVDVVKNADSSYRRCNDCMYGYQIHVADTETSKVELLQRDVYRDLFKSKELGVEVKTIGKEE